MFSRKTSSARIDSKINNQIVELNTTVATTNDTDVDTSDVNDDIDIDIDVNDKDAVENTTASNKCPLSIDVTKQDENENEEGSFDIEAQIHFLHDMIAIKFELLEQKNQEEFDAIKRMLNPTFDSPRRWTKPLSGHRHPTIRSDDDTMANSNNEVPNIKEVPHVVLKKNYFKSLMKSLKRKVKTLF